MRPAVGRARPAISLRSVDFPDPDRPRRPTIWPSARVRSTPSRTRSSPWSAFGKARRTWWTSSRGSEATSAQPELLFGVPVEGTPERAIEDDDEEAHDGDPDHDAVIVARLGGSRDVSAEAVRLETAIAPGRDLGDDARIPRPARGGDRSRHVEGKYSRKRDPPPPQPAA